MPLYEFQCKDCHQTLEVIQRVSDPPPQECPQCGGTMTKLLSAPAIRFKGEGWYITDYSSKGKEPKKEDKDSKDKDSKGKDTKSKSEGKTESKTESKGEGKASKESKKSSS
ncbi:MAG TPA: zinc ribbon domain-containing protein [Acidobacteriota bacterium]|nr:zinc ribbon domain-containing protein [Acidobacteriota bacterium]